MIETLLDYLFNTSEYRKEHNLGFIVRDENKLFKQFIDQLPDGFKLSWKLFKDLKG